MSDRAKKKRGTGEVFLTEDLLAAVAEMRLACSDEAERGLLSCLLQDPQNRISEARQKLELEAFFHVQHRELYKLLLAMDAASPPQPIDIVTVTRHLRDLGLLDTVGGASAISDLFTLLSITSHFSSYLKIITDKWRLRQLTHACVENLHAIAKHGSEAVDESVMELVATAENRVFHVLQTVQAGGEYSTGPVPASEGVMRWLDHMAEVESNKGKIMGLTTGILELDQTLHGLDDKEGEITIVAARPGQGKTGMGCVFIDHMGVEMLWPGLVFSAEMSGNQLYTRLILGKSKIDTSKAITGMFSRGDHEAMVVQASKARKAPFEISDGSCITTADLRAQVQVAKRKYGIRWIVVDHLHLIKPVSDRGKADPREQIVEVMETLQFIKKYYHVSVLLMVQLNRETDRNAGKPPVLADLSGSAAIEWYADHVLMLHRDSYFIPWHTLSEEKQNAWRRAIEPRRGRSPELWSDGQKYDEDDGGWARQDYEELARIFVRKNRRGPTPEIHIRFEDWRTWFSTRMPKLNSTNPLDWQMGSYAVPKKAKSQKQTVRKPKQDDDWDADFKGGDELPMG